MRTVTCKHCGTHNGYKAHFCEACGKKLTKSSSSDSIGILVILAVVLCVLTYAYYKGYRLGDLPALLSHIK